MFKLRLVLVVNFLIAVNLVHAGEGISASSNMENFDPILYPEHGLIHPVATVGKKNPYIRRSSTEREKINKLKQVVQQDFVQQGWSTISK